MRLHWSGPIGRAFLSRHLGADLPGSFLQDDVDGRADPRVMPGDGHDGQKNCVAFVPQFMSAREPHPFSRMLARLALADR
jgi:hypothetical protein